MKNKKIKVSLVTSSILVAVFASITFFANLSSVSATDNAQDACDSYCKRYDACVKQKVKAGESGSGCKKEVPVPKGCNGSCATPQ